MVSGVSIYSQGDTGIQLLADTEATIEVNVAIGPLLKPAMPVSQYLSRLYVYMATLIIHEFLLAL